MKTSAKQFLTSTLKAMGRNIVTQKQLATITQAGQEPPTQKPDNYAAQIVKLIPVEVVGVYLGISNLVAGQQIAEPALTVIQSVVFVLLLAITPFYLWRVAGVSNRPQIIVATVSFFVWAVSLGGPFESALKDHLPQGTTVKFLGGILLMLYTLVVPMFYKAVPQAGTDS